LSSDFKSSLESEEEYLSEETYDIDDDLSNDLDDTKRTILIPLQTSGNKVLKSHWQLPFYACVTLFG